MGLIMLIMVGIIPTIYALDLNGDVGQLLLAAQKSATAVLAAHHGTASAPMDDKAVSAELTQYLRSGKDSDKTFAALELKSKTIEPKLAGKTTLKDIPKVDRKQQRRNGFEAVYAVFYRVAQNCLIDLFEIQVDGVVAQAFGSIKRP